MTPRAHNGSCIVCDQQGTVLKVLKDDINIFTNIQLPVPVFSLFDKSSRQKALEFWNALQKESAIFDWKLKANTKPLPAFYKFSGFVTGNEILITASSYDKALLAMFEELIKINNEQQNLVRQSAKSVSVLKKKSNVKEVDILNEMTLLNNELVNTQRQLSKQNVEITRLNKQLVNINTDLEQFTYMISHDLKEPLRMVKSFMALLKSKYAYQLDEKAITYINFAFDGSKRMENMISDLLELSRTGRKDAVKEVIHLDEILKAVKQNILKLTNDKQAEIIVKSPLPVVAVYIADFTRLLQNLLGNAVKFRQMEINPLIVLDVQEKANEWLFSVEDNGIGIEKEKLEKVFEIFTRLHSREEYEGTGIGLAICKKVVEIHGGKIWVESESGKGSTFYFTIKK